MYKDFLIPLMMGDFASPVLKATCAIAKAWEGRVIALVGVSQIAPIARAWDYYPAGVYESMRDCALATTQRMAEAADLLLRDEGVPYDIRMSEDYWLTPAEIATSYARYADLTVLEMGGSEAEMRHRVFAAVAAGAGHPVLSMQATSPPTAAFGHAVVAWKASRESARALSDALPWLRRMATVDLLTVEEASSKPNPLDALLSNHLDRHGVRTRLVRRSAAQSSAGAEIVHHAAESRADLIVAGAYSHSRLVEHVLGGATRHLLSNAPCPVLFAH